MEHKRWALATAREIASEHTHTQEQYTTLLGDIGKALESAIARGRKEAVDALRTTAKSARNEAEGWQQKGFPASSERIRAETLEQMASYLEEAFELKPKT